MVVCRGRKRRRTFRQAALQVDEMDYADEEPDFDPEEEAREAAAKKAPKVPLEGWGKLERGHVSRVWCWTESVLGAV